MRIYDTRSGQIASKIPWYFQLLGWHPIAPLRRIRWLDNQTIAFRHDLILETPGFENVTLNSFTGDIDIELLTDIVPPDAAYDFYPSPDWTRSVSTPYVASDMWFVHDLENGDQLSTFDSHRLSIIDWTHDSDHFIFELSSEADMSLLLFSRQARPVETIYSINRPDRRGLGGNFGIWAHAWSNDDRYFAFVSYPQTDGIGYLHIADVQTKTVINTCIEVSDAGAVWLGPNYQLAVMEAGQDQRAVHIFDLERWQALRVAYHSGRLIGWRADD